MLNRHCEEPTGPAQLGRPDDRLSDEAIHSAASGQVDCFASLAMTMGRSSFNHSAHSLCGAQEMSESQILNANPLCEDFRQSFATHSFDIDFCPGARWHKA
jgi:hypothetical protein